MAISNFIPSSRVMQPGVCTSTTRPASPYEGMVIYETDTNKTYVWNGSAWVMMVAADSPPGLELISTKTISSATEINFTSLLSATYDNYRIIFSASTTQTAAQNQINFRLRSGSTDLSSAGSYRWSRHYFYSGGTGSSGSTSDTLINMSDANTGQIFFSFDLYAPYLSQKTAIQGQTVASQGPGGPYLFGITWAGENTNTNSYDGFSILGTSSFSGTAKLYGYRNSI